VTGIIVDLVAHTPTVAVPWLGTIAAWRITFLFVGVPGVAFALLVYTIREPVRRELLRSRDGRIQQLNFSESLVAMGGGGNRSWGFRSGRFFRPCQPMP
jgi:hypothetical protein